jgi:hypothetical protein
MGNSVIAHLSASFGICVLINIYAELGWRGQEN